MKLFLKHYFSHPEKPNTSSTLRRHCNFRPWTVKFLCRKCIIQWLRLFSKQQWMDGSFSWSAFRLWNATKLMHLLSVVLRHESNSREDTMRISRSVIFCMNYHLRPYCTYASKCSGEAVRARRLVWSFTIPGTLYTHIRYKYQNFINWLI